MAITNLQVVTGYYDSLGTPSIESAVTSQLVAGWIPHGAPILTDVYGQVAQTMVKSTNLLTTAYTVVTGATPMAPDDTWDTMGNPTWIESGRYLQAYTKGDQMSANIDLNAQVTGVLPVANGGTGATNANAAWPNIRPTGSTPLSADPVNNLDAATKGWTDTRIDQVSTSLTESINGVSDDLDEFVTNLSSNKGLTYIGQITSVADFYNQVGNPGDRLILKGWYKGSTYGAGIFDYTTDVQRSKHDGGCIISPMVPYNGDALSGQYVNGTGGTSTLTYGCWVRRNVTEIMGEHYGMSGNPVADVDYYPHLSKVILRAATDGKGVLLPPNVCKINNPVNIPIHQRANGLVKYVKGYGEKLSILNFRAATTGATAFGLTLEGSLSVFSSFKLSDFSMNAVDDSGNRADWAGHGLKFNKVIRLDADNINIDGFEIGANMTDSLYLKFSNVRFSYNRTALQGRLGELTGANAVDLVRCDFYNNAQFCVELQHSHAFKFDTCCFEANGGKSTSGGTPIEFNSCVQFAQIGGAGNVAGTFDTCYFENNTGTDISFYVNRDLNQIVNVYNTIFNYKSETAKGARILVHSNLANMSDGTQAILNVKGCGFWNITPATAPKYRDVQYAVPETFGVSHLVFNDIGNKWSQSPSFIGLNKVFLTFDGSSIARCLVTAAGVASLSQNVVSVSKTGTGAYLINFTTSIANAIPMIYLPFGSGRYANYSKPSDYSIAVTTFNNTGSQVDLPFNIAVV